MEIEPIPIEVSQMDQIPFKGHVVPSMWYKRLKFPSGLVHLPAIIILAEICWWYTPIEIKDNDTNEVIGLKCKFEGNKLRKSYKSFESLGLTKKQIVAACEFLQKENIIFLEAKTANIDGINRSNQLFIGINPIKIKELNKVTTALIPKDIAFPQGNEVRHSGERGTPIPPPGNATDNINRNIKRDLDLNQGEGEKRTTKISGSQKLDEKILNPKKIGKRLNQEWSISPSLKNTILKNICPDMGDEEMNEVLTDFVDYWLGVSGQKGVKLDWDATFRRWVRSYVRRDRLHTKYSPPKETKETNAERKARESREYRRRLSETPGVDPFADDPVFGTSGNGKI